MRYSESTPTSEQAAKIRIIQGHSSSQASSVSRLVVFSGLSKWKRRIHHWLFQPISFKESDENNDWSRVTTEEKYTIDSHTFMAFFVRRFAPGSSTSTSSIKPTRLKCPSWRLKLPRPPLGFNLFHTYKDSRCTFKHWTLRPAAPELRRPELEPATRFSYISRARGYHRGSLSDEATPFLRALYGLHTAKKMSI